MCEFFADLNSDERFDKNIEKFPEEWIIGNEIKNPIYLKNLFLALKGQLPWKRLYKNFFITKNGWGMFHINSHISFRSGKPKISYSLKSAQKATKKMGEKQNTHFSVYKCVYCDGYHIGKNRNNKTD